MNYCGVLGMVAENYKRNAMRKCKPFKRVRNARNVNPALYLGAKQTLWRL